MSTNSLEETKVFMMPSMHSAGLVEWLGAGSDANREERVSWWLWLALGLLAVGLVYFFQYSRFRFLQHISRLFGPHSLYL